MSDTVSIHKYPAKHLPPQYKSLVFSKWLRSFRFGNPDFEKINSDEYFKHYHLFIENLMNKPDSVIRLAVLTDDRDVVLGFSVSREDVLDYIHVHRDHRKQGIGSMLVPEGTTTFSHITKTATEIWLKVPRYKKLKFNPFA